MSLDVVILSPVLGAEVRGIDGSKPLNDEEISTLRDTYRRHHLVLLRDQRLTRDDFERLVGYFWPVKRNDDGTPWWTAVSNVDPANGTGTGVLLYHQDEAFQQPPTASLALYANQAAPDCAPTTFANAVRAAEVMPPDLRAALEPLQARHIVDFLCTEGDSTYRVIERELPSDAPLSRFPRTDHPIFKPVNPDAELALFVTEHQTSHLQGVSEDEGEVLLQRCFDVLYADDNTFVHRWQPHDVLVWNNLALQHGRPSLVRGGPRDFWRLKTFEPATPAGAVPAASTARAALPA